MNKYIFKNLPKKIQISNYEQVCDLIVDKLKNNASIKAIYLSSGKWTPGISDLDIIVVYNKNKKGILIPDFREISEKAKYVLLHSFWELDEESFKNVNYISPGLNLKLLHGEEIINFEPKKELKEREYSFFLLGVIFDYLINKLLLFPKFLDKKEIDVRQLLGHIHSLKYTLEIFNIVCPGFIKSDFPLKIKKLRNNWFDEKIEDNLEELMDLLNQSIDLILEIVTGLDKFIKDNKLQTQNIVFKNRKYYTTFKENWTKNDFLETFNKKYISLKKPFSNRVLENFRLVLPISLSYFFLAYIQKQGSLSNWIRKSLNYKKNNLEINNGLGKHIDILNNSFKKTADYGFSRIPFSYGTMISRQTKISYLGDKIILFLRAINK